MLSPIFLSLSPLYTGQRSQTVFILRADYLGKSAFAQIYLLRSSDEDNRLDTPLMILSQAVM